MTMFAQSLNSSDTSTPDELIALAQLEGTPNAIRLRIAALAPDQLYRGTVDRLSIAEEVALAVDRERAYLDAFRRAQSEARPQLIEPQPGPGLLDREFDVDLAMFFDLRRATLDLLRAINDHGFAQVVSIPGGSAASLRELTVRLAQRDSAMLRTISDQRRGFLRTTGVNELRDAGVAGKLGPNIGQ